MTKNRLYAALACACLLSLSACDKDSPEDRINAALPLRFQARDAKLKLVALAEKFGQADAVEKEYAARMKLRALECSHGYLPAAGDSERDIREHFTDGACLAASDLSLEAWLGQRMVALLATAAPLRELPKDPPPKISVDASIGLTQFADNAGIALLNVAGGYRIVDLNNGQTLSGGTDHAASLSPNGRLVATGKDGDAAVRSTEDASVLAVFKGVEYYRLNWVGNTGLVYTAPKETVDHQSLPRELVYLDLASGEVSKLPFGSDEVFAIAPRRWQPNHYVLFGANHIGEMVVETSAGSTKARLLSDTSPAQGLYWSRDAMGLTANDAYFYGSRGEPELADLSTMQIAQVSTEPMILHGVAGTPDPDKLLLTANFRGDLLPANYLYSISQQSIAKVTPGQYPGTRVVWARALKRNAVINDSDLLFPGTLQASAPVAATEFLQQHAVQPAAVVQAEQANDAAYRQATEELARKEAAAASAPIPGPVAELGKNAVIETIGVYEGNRRSGSRSGYDNADVQVHVRKSSKPMILVLASYSRLNWVITLEPGANLVAILNASYEGTQVFGGGDAKVYEIGREYAYERNSDSFDHLERQVQRWTGQNIGHFQGDYKGNMYFVGR